MATRGKDNVRYLQPINVESGNQRNTVALKKSGIKYIDYKDPDYLLRFVNPQG